RPRAAALRAVRRRAGSGPMSDAHRRTALQAKQAARVGMTLAVHAREAPERPAIFCGHGDRSLGELNARANRLARALRSRGLQPGEAVALVCGNRAEFVEAHSAALRSGLRLTPINWHS